MDRREPNVRFRIWLREAGFSQYETDPLNQIVDERKVKFIRAVTVHAKRRPI